MPLTCTSCARPADAAPGGPCPHCGAALPAGTCAYCLTAIAPDETVGNCPVCNAGYHQECWTENGGCAVYGCTAGPEVKPREAIEIPVSFWGREQKPCPACGQEILAAAVRCRHCGATFASARPEASVEFQERNARAGRLPALQTQAVWLFILGVIPFFSPLAAIGGAIWWAKHRADIPHLPALHQALAKLGLAAAVAISVALVALTGAYGLFHS